MRTKRIHAFSIGCCVLLALPAIPAAAGVGDGSVVSTTKIQDNGPDAQRFNIVIMGDGFQAGEMATYEARAQEVVDAFNANLTYGACDQAVNFYRVNVRSDDSGVDKPAPCYSPAVSKDTYLDSHYCASGIQRCVWSTNTALVQATASGATANWHYVVVLVNDSEHGGCAGGNLTFNATGPGFQSTVMHELGHALGGLGDEYEYGGADHWVGGEPGSPNLTAQTNRGDVKWFDLILPTTPVPTWNRPDCTTSGQLPPAQWEDVIGTYEGGAYRRCGIFHPDRSCLMRTLSAPFDEVCNRRVRQVMMVHAASGNLSITPWGYFQTPKTSPLWQTPDVWVDNNANGVQEADEPSIGKPDNHLFARVTNSGSAHSGAFQVRFSYVPYTGVIDMANSQHIHTAARPSLAPGGTDDVEVLWPLDNIPPQFAGVDHFCVIVEILSDECPTGDNRAQNNFANVPTQGPTPAPVALYVKNIHDVPAVGKIRIEPQPGDWEFSANVPDLENIPLAAKEEKLIVVEFEHRRSKEEGEDQAVERQFDVTFLLNNEILGGVSPNVIVQPAAAGRWSLSYHVGVTDPVGNLGRVLTEGPSFGFDVAYEFRPRWFAVGLLGYHTFDFRSPIGGDFYIWSLSANLKRQLTAGSVRPYVNGGLGLYDPKSGSTEPGANLGLGVDFLYSPRWTFEVGADWHQVWASPSNVEFNVYHLGLLYHF